MSNRGGARKGAGRPKGAKSKANQQVAERLAELECDPIEGMAIIAKEMMEEGRLAADFKDKQAAFKTAGDMYKELGQYVAPKLRSVEHSSSTESPVIPPSITILPVSAEHQG